MHKSVAFLFALLGLLSAVADACAAEAQPAAQPVPIELPSASPLLGGWTGKIGKHAVLVCFAHVNSSYYYGSQLSSHRGLMLAALDAQGRTWEETEMVAPKPQTTGRWKLDAPKGDVLEGQWSSPEGKSPLPIHLERGRSPAGERKTCDFYAMQVKLGFDPARIVEGGERELSGTRYRTLSSLDGSISTIQFVDAGGNYAAHNEKLRKDFEGQINNGLECQKTVGGSDSMLEWPASYTVAPVSVHGARWVTLRESESGWCGGAHPYADSSLITVDIRTGERVSVSAWLKQDEEGMLPAKLDKLLAARILKQRHATSGGDDCDGIYTGGEDGRGDFPGYSVSLGNQGLVFYKSLPHVVYACTEEVEIPFVQLRPFLTKAGQAAVQLLQQGARPEGKPGAAPGVTSP